MKSRAKYVFVVGGVMSGVGKGIATSSIALILESKGFKVNPIKIDPYLNVDAGTMNPTEHGEVFVLASGLETDQDMGNYERFLGRSLASHNYLTSGMVYSEVIARERALKYGGKCVEAIPHIRDYIIEKITRSSKESKTDVTVVEIGGTIGDYQNIMFIEAARVLKVQHPDDVMFIMVSYMPVPSSLGEMKTRPTQTAVRMLNSYGVQPDMIIARSENAMDEKRKEKLAISCNVRSDHVISAPNITSIYDVPMNFEKDAIGNIILKSLKLTRRARPTNLTAWAAFAAKVKNGHTPVSVGIVGKYFDTGDYVLSDAYLSVIEALKFSGALLGVKPKISWVNAKDIEKGDAKKILKEFDAIIVPGGFGESGVEGKIKAIEYARVNKVPYLGLCYGMQLMVVEYARNVLGLKDAHTVEVNPESVHPVIAVMEEQKAMILEGNMGGTMRLGEYVAHLKKGSVVAGVYGSLEVVERHRHRFEVNPAYIADMEGAGLVFSGTSPDRVLMEFAELPKKVHPYFVGTQAHPELLARPLLPHPLFTGLLKAAQARLKK